MDAQLEELESRVDDKIVKLSLQLLIPKSTKTSQ